MAACWTAVALAQPPAEAQALFGLAGGVAGLAGFPFGGLIAGNARFESAVAFHDRSPGLS